MAAILQSIADFLADYGWYVVCFFMGFIINQAGWLIVFRRELKNEQSEQDEPLSQDNEPHNN